MAKIAGTLMPLNPNVPVVSSENVSGGFRSVANETERLAIPVSMLEVGSHVFQDDTNATWRVLSIEGQTVSWEEVPSDAATWNTLQGKPAVIAAGENAAAARAAIGAGTGDVTLAGVQTLTNKTITETVFAVTGTTPALTATNGAVQTWALTAASTPTNALTSGQSIILVITPGAYAITWPSVTWTKQGGSGAAPTLFTAGKTSVVLWMVGSILYGTHLGDTV